MPEPVTSQTPITNTAPTANATPVPPAAAAPPAWAGPELPVPEIPPAPTVPQRDPAIAQLLAQQTRLAETLAKLSAKPKGAPRLDEYGEPVEEARTDPQIAEIKSQLNELTTAIRQQQADNRRFSEQMEVGTVERQALLLCDELAASHEFTQGNKSAAAKIKRTVVGQLLAIARANPSGHGLTRTHVERLFAQELNEQRDIVLSSPHSAAQAAGTAQQINAGSMPTPTGGSTPAGESRAVNLDPNSDEYWQQKSREVRTTAAARVAARQNA